MENRTIDKVRETFYAELTTRGDYWRIFRESTLVDLVKYSFFSFQNERNEGHLIDMFNHLMKIKMLSSLDTIETSGNLSDFSKKFNRDTNLILKQYDGILNDLQQSFKEYTSSSVHELNKKIQYLKVINQLEIDSYEDDIFDEIICILYNILHAGNY